MRAAGVVALAIAVLVTFWGVRFYQANTFEDEGWRSLSSRERMLTLEAITSACARAHTPSVVETP